MKSHEYICEKVGEERKAASHAYLPNVTWS
jgi:hypothetical protein